MEGREREKQSFLWGFLWGFAAMLFLAISAMALLWAIDSGNFFSAHKKDRTAQETVTSFETKQNLKQLAQTIDKYYYKDVSGEQIEEGLYYGLLDSLGDTYSRYYNPEEYQSLMESANGTYFGIGAVLSQDKETMQIKVLHVYEGAPAREAGIYDGDIMEQVDGIEAEGQELAELVKHIKGEEGGTVHIVVSRQGDRLEFDVVRREIQVPTVEYQMLGDTAGYLKITEFSNLTAEQFQAAVQKLREQGMTALLIDVRDNPGGTLNSVCDILDQILPEGITVYTEDKYGNRKNYKSDAETYLNLPLVVLVNENSASAAEIFAGAIKDYEYGTLIGTKTFGKGIVQQIIALEDGSALKLTTSRYFTPEGNYIHEVGIQPDIELEYEYSGSKDGEYDVMQDNQVQKAMEVLQGQ